MKLLPAVPEDHSPFSVLGFLPGYQRFLILVRWTSYSCPHCGRVFRRDFWLTNVKLGGGQRTCKECGMLFDDGSREWPVLGLAKRLRFVFTPALVGIWGGFSLAGIIVAFAGVRDDHSFFVAMFASGVGVIPMVLLSPLKTIAVFRSRRRYGTAHSTSGMSWTKS